MFQDRRTPFSDPAKELEYNLARHTLRLHFDSLMMITSSLASIRSGSGAAQLWSQLDELAERVCRDLDAIDALLPESLDEEPACGADAPPRDEAPPARDAASGDHV